MARVKTFVNGGSLLPSDLNSIEDDYETAFSGYKTIRTASIRLDAPTTGTYLFIEGSAGAGVLAAGATAGMAAAYLDPAWFTANTRSTFYRLHVSLLTNATAVGTVTLTTGLYTVSASAGAAATVAVTLSGTALTGSTAAFVNPLASNGGAQANSGDFAAPAAGYTAFAVVVSANAAASSSVALRASLQIRQV